MSSRNNDNSDNNNENSKRNPKRLSWETPREEFGSFMTLYANEGEDAQLLASESNFGLVHSWMFNESFGNWASSRFGHQHDSPNNYGQVEMDARLLGH